MASPGNWGFRATVAGSAVTAAAGLGLFLYSRTLPVFTVPFEVASAARQRWCSPDGDVVDATAGPQFSALFGSRYMLGDAGIGICLLGLSLATLALVLRYRAPEPGARWFVTPDSRAALALLVLGACTLVGLETVLNTDRDLARGYLCSDVYLRAAPIMLGGMVIIGAILAGVTQLLAIGFGKLPAPLLRWDAARPVRSWIVTVIFVPVILAAGAATVATALSAQSLATPALFLLCYASASIRAALLTGEDVPIPQSDPISVLPA